MLSSWDPEDEICSAVAREFANWKVCMAARMISRSLNSSFSLLDVQSYLGAEIGELYLPHPYSAGSRHFTFCRLRGFGKVQEAAVLNSNFKGPFAIILVVTLRFKLLLETLRGTVIPPNF